MINYINASGSGLVPDNANNSKPFLDVTGDNFVAPNDVLDVINAINAGQGGEGESQGSLATAQLSVSGNQLPVTGDLLALLAADQELQASRRRR